MRDRIATIAMVAMIAATGWSSGSAVALVGDATPADWTMIRPTVMIMAPRTACSAVILAQDLVLTAAHCVPDAQRYAVAGVIGAKPFRLSDVTTIERHPDFGRSQRSAADLALLKLPKPLPTGFVAAFRDPRPVTIGERLTVVGYGLSAEAAKKSFGMPRMALLTVESRSGDWFSLTDRNGSQGSCSGDSGGPAFATRGGVPALAGVVSRGDCRGSTLAIAYATYRQWIIDTADRLGTTIGP